MSHRFTVPGVFSAMDVAASGLTAERGRMNIIASNLANAQTTKGPDAKNMARLQEFYRDTVVGKLKSELALKNVNEVRLSGVQADTTPGQMVYDPGHPDANAEGYVQYPNVNVVTEMVNLMTASRAYEAGVSSIESLKSMARDAIKIGQ